MTNSSKGGFNQAVERSETPLEKKKRLEAQAKALDESLRRPPTPTMKLTPDGQLRRDGDQFAKEEINRQRVDIFKELEDVKAQIKEQGLDKDKDKDIDRDR